MFDNFTKNKVSLWISTLLFMLSIILTAAVFSVQPVQAEGLTPNSDCEIVTFVKSHVLCNHNNCLNNPCYCNGGPQDCWKDGVENYYHYVNQCTGESFYYWDFIRCDYKCSHCS